MINDLAESQLISAMKDQNLTAVMYWLNHRHNIYRNKLEISGDVNVKNKKLSREEEKEIMRALKLASLITNNNRNGGSNETKSKSDKEINSKSENKK